MGTFWCQASSARSRVKPAPMEDGVQVDVVALHRALVNRSEFHGADVWERRQVGPVEIDERPDEIVAISEDAVLDPANVGVESSDRVLADRERESRRLEVADEVSRVEAFPW